MRSSLASPHRIYLHAELRPFLELHANTGSLILELYHQEDI